MAHHPGINGKGTRPAAPPIGVVEGIFLRGRDRLLCFLSEMVMVVIIMLYLA
jgi:hypothetical protein